MYFIFFKATSMSLDYTLTKVKSLENVVGFHQVNTCIKENADRNSVARAIGRESSRRRSVWGAGRPQCALAATSG